MFEYRRKQDGFVWLLCMEGKMKSLLQYLRGYKKECILGPLFKMLEACFDLTVPYVTALMIVRVLRIMIQGGSEGIVLC